MAVSVQTTPTTITPGRPDELFAYSDRLQFEARDVLSTAPYDAAPSGDGFVGSQQPGSTLSGNSSATARPKVRVVLNWFEELQRLVPTE
jgi:hypothetical protein